MWILYKLLNHTSSCLNGQTNAIQGTLHELWLMLIDISPEYFYEFLLAFDRMCRISTYR